MDEFFDHYLSSSSWSDVNATERSSWVANGLTQTGLLADSDGVCEGDKKNSPISMIPSSRNMENLATQGTIFVVGDSNYGLDKGLPLGEAQNQQDGSTCARKPSLNEVVNGSSKAEYFCMQLNTTMSTPATLNLSSPKLLPVVHGFADSPCSLHKSGPVGSNGSEPCEVHQSLRDSHSFPSIPQLWPSPPYGGVASSSPTMKQHKLQGFGFQGEYMDSEAKVLENRCLGGEKFLQHDKLSASVSINGQGELHNYPLSSFAAGPQITMTKTAGSHSHPQLSQLSEGNPINHYMIQHPVSQLQPAPATAAGGLNGAVKPRVRARRGQATDPHSIAERLRREKIAERMKDLQELVPNSNKGSNRLILSPSAGLGADLSESPDNIAFEQEVVKLMESNVTMAMKYLQSKGLCLMPTALATAISSLKASVGTVSSERKKAGSTHGLGPHNNGLPDIGIRQMYSDSDNVRNHKREGSTTNGCTGAVVKQEVEKNTSCTATEMKPKA
ncbi:hypothetical protein HHK36_021938 [Tetracentron sinense]|uniref:BHLH domain-containing protein n=1 Tax=Tetracentron sinense TaxID=13715 RepID=A0A835D8B3_TETSI|nr:hypothetical protein HHK36_021938 [Tetracentron sinense]